MISRALNVLRLVYFPGLDFRVGDDNGHAFLQVVCVDGTDNVTGEPMDWRGRKWRLSEHMTDSEIVGTALAAIKMAYEHEIREKFLYKGQMIYGPHFDIEALYELAKTPAGHDKRVETDTRGGGEEAQEKKSLMPFDVIDRAPVRTCPLCKGEGGWDFYDSPRGDDDSTSYGISSLECPLCGGNGETEAMTCEEMQEALKK